MPHSVLPRSFLAKCYLILAYVSLVSSSAIPPKRAVPIQVTGNGTTYTGTQVDGQDVFLGIPYAQPPVGNLRFRRPLPVTAGPAVNAQNYGPRCLQSTASNDTSEDCLTLNIWRPHGVTKLMPVMLWIYGGSFIMGDSQTYPGSGIVATSVSEGQPVIYVSFNYRLGFFGCKSPSYSHSHNLISPHISVPVGKQAADKNSMNLGLYDQRLAIEWVQNHIRYFGGDPTKVTLFGESAGAISVSYQMLYRNGQINGAFRAAIMQSAAPASYKSTLQSTPPRQAVYDHIASQTGCSNALDSFECLRTLDVNVLQNVHVGTYALPPELVAFANFPAVYGPVTDPRDDFLPDASSKLVKAGKYANIPIISGSNLDEGTWFVNNPQTPSDIISFLAEAQPAQAFALNSSVTTRLLEFYPDVLPAGSPYGTGNETFGRAREYKRAASLVGDLVFTAPRRVFIRDAVSRNRQVWSYLFTQPTTGPPEYGVSHSSEILYVFAFLPADAAAGDLEVSNHMTRYWISFANFLNPRPDDSNLPEWPSYGSGRKMIQLQAGNYTTVLDTFREAATAFIAGNSLLFA